MDLEQLLAAQQTAQQLQAQGHATDEIDRLIAESDLNVNSIAELDRQVARAQQAQRDVEDEGIGSQILANVSQGISAGFAGDLFRMLEKVPGTPDDLDERHAALLERSREEHPILSAVGNIGGAIGGAPGRAAGAGMGILKTVAGAGRRAASGAAQRMGAGRGAQAAAGVAGGTTAGGIGGGLLGAAEAGTMAAGESRSRPLPASPGQAVEEGKDAAPIGGLIGVPLAGAASMAGEVRGLLGGAAGRRDALTGALRRESQLPSGAQVRNRIEQAGNQKSAAYAQALADDVTIPPSVSQQVMQHPDPATRTALRQSLKQVRSHESRQFLREWDAYQTALREAQEAASERVPRLLDADRLTTPDTSTPMLTPKPPVMSAQLADDLRQQAKRTADAHKVAQIGDNPRAGTGEVREAGGVVAALDEVLEEVPGYNAAQDLAHLQGAQQRAWDAGQKWMAPGTSADEMTEQLAKLPAGEAQEAARVGALKRVFQRLGARDSSVASFITDMQESPEARRKMELIIGDEGRFNSFLEEVSNAASDMRREEMIQTAIKYAGFMFGGSSLAGGIAGGLLVN